LRRFLFIELVKRTLLWGEPYFITFSLVFNFCSLFIAHPKLLSNYFDFLCSENFKFFAAFSIAC